MKKILFLLLPFLMGESIYAQCVVKAELKDVTGDTAFVQLAKNDLSGIERTDTLKVKKGKFTIQNNDSKMRMALCKLKTAEGEKSLNIYLVPGENGTVKGTTDKHVWDGTQFYKEYQELNNMTNPIQEKMDEMGKSYEEQVEAGADADSLKKVINPIYQGLMEQFVQARMDFITTHPNSGAGVTMLLGFKDAEKALEKMTGVVADGRYSNIIDIVKAHIKREKARDEARKVVADGKMAPDFTLKSIDGSDLSLSSLRGKYVILDFWGSWCIWCIRGIPGMKEAYSKYKDKMEILGVDCQDTEEKWKAAVEEHQLPWLQVRCPEDYLQTLGQQYGIQGFPTKVIIDPEGRLVKVVVGEDPAFYTFLDQLFAK